MVKTYLTTRQAYEAPDTSVTQIQMETRFLDSITTTNNEIQDMYLEEIEDEAFE